MKYLNRITNIYVFIILFIYPLIIGINGYKNILSIKWNFYVYISITYMVILLVLTLILILKKRIDIKDFDFKIYHILALIYIFVLIISTLLSPYYKDYNLFMGSPRMEGLIVNIIYLLSFIFVSLTYNYKKRIIDVFLIPSIIIGIIIIMQYIGFNPFYIYKIGNNNIFYGTIGNIDMIGMLYCMYITCIIVKYIFYNINKVLVILSFIISIIVMFIINVEALYFTLIILFLLILPIVILDSNYLKRYLDILLAIVVLSLINTYNYFVIIFIISIIIILIRLLINKKVYRIINKKNIIISYICLSIFIIILLVIIYFNKFNISFLNDINNILHLNFNDKLGNYRIFLWKRSIKMFDRGILLGTGPDTFYIRFMNDYLDDLMKLGTITINDTACNIYITMLINNGIIGLSIFLIFIYSLLKKFIDNRNYLIFLIIISYLIYNFFSFQTVIIAPIFFALLALYAKYKKILDFI